MNDLSKMYVLYSGISYLTDLENSEQQYRDDL